MPISRDARMDRRRRLLRENGDDEPQSNVTTRRRSRRPSEEELPEIAGAKRKAGYSQDVRKACGQRLVQLIPVRRRSFAAVCFISLLIPGLLLTAHYLIHVKGLNDWWRHPLAVAMDVGHSRSIAAWLSSQLWLLCLAATVLTFQLRKHKLDDYNGEYRLWSWLVLTCLVASIDATTDITQLFASALNRWTQLNLGWSGPAVVDSTLAVLVGMLGLRMCTELKSVPLSLVLWLSGLVAWAASAALARPELKLEMSEPIRYWLISVFWLGGLTVIWLSALTYLRSIYVEAQRRFLLRGRLASAGVPLGQRIRESMPSMPGFRRGTAAEQELQAEGEGLQRSRWGMPSMPNFLKRNRVQSEPDVAPPSASSRARGVREHEVIAVPSTQPSTRQIDAVPARHSASTAEHEQLAEPAARRGLGGFLRRNSRADSPVDKSVARDSNAVAEPKPSRFGNWLRRPKDSDEAEEYRKVSKTRPEKSSIASDRSKRNREQLVDDESAEPVQRRKWIPKIPRPNFTRPRIPTIPKPNLGGFLSRLKMPKLPSLRLAPPEELDADDLSLKQPRELRPVSSDNQFPGTNASQEEDFFDDDNDGRPLSKAERKRMRRIQQQNRRSA